MIRKQTSTFGSLFPLALACAAAAAAAGCEATEGTDSDALGGGPIVQAQLEDLSVRLQVLEDREAIRGVAECYGRGHDEIFRHLQGDQGAALAMLRECHTQDVQTDVFFFTEDAPAAQLKSLQELVGFIEQFAVNTKYLHARNVVGDIGIQLTGPDTAVMSSATSAPHFIRPTGTGVEPTLDLVSAHYRDEVVRGVDGVWRSRKKVLILDQVWRGTGSYPFAM